MRKISPALSLAFGLAAAAAMPGQPRAATLTTLVSFNNTDGEGPTAGLITDAAGNLFGTTAGGGEHGLGTLFEIGKTAVGYASTPATLYSFCTQSGCTDGRNVNAGLIADAHGNLFGTTAGGGTYGDGIVFELVKTAAGYAGTPTTLVSFNGADGAGPVASLITNAHGNLFGTTENGGASGVFGPGTAFEIAKTAAGYASAPTTLVNFNGANGAYPVASLIADARGNLFGTTHQGGASGLDGTVFEITKTGGGYASTPTVLVSFNNTDGAFPLASLIADARGNLFGTTSVGGAYHGGTVFEIAKTASGYASTPTTLYSFCAQAGCSDGASPFAGLIADAHGNLFGTTYSGGAYGNGTVFEIAKTHRGYANTTTILASFGSANGAHPFASLIADATGNLFGTTESGGSQNFGTVFEVTGSGFVPKAIFAGTPGTPRCIGTSVRRLARQYGGLHAAAAALDYASVRDLLNAIGAYCEV